MTKGKGRFFTWRPFNHTYGPWYEMFEVKEAIATELRDQHGKVVRALVQPDMDREGWYWSVRWAAYRPALPMAKPGEARTKPKKDPLPERRMGGKVATREDAMAEARSAFLGGRPR